MAMIRYFISYRSTSKRGKSLVLIKYFERYPVKEIFIVKIGSGIQTLLHLSNHSHCLPAPSTSLVFCEGLFFSVHKQEYLYYLLQSLRNISWLLRDIRWLWTFWSNSLYCFLFEDNTFVPWNTWCTRNCCKKILWDELHLSLKFC